jgi:hypothetical protein
MGMIILRTFDFIEAVPSKTRISINIDMSGLHGHEVIPQIAFASIDLTQMLV